MHQQLCNMAKPTWEDTVAGEDRAFWRAMAAFYVVTLMMASLSNDCRPSRAAPGETLGFGLLDRMMAALWCRFLSWEHHLWSSTG
jgi:hypothetical protein